MLCSRFLRPPADERHGRFYDATERVFDAHARGSTSAASRWVLRHRPATMVVSLADPRRDRLPLRARPEGLHSRTRTRRDLRRHRGGAGRRRSRRWCSYQQAVADDRPPGPERRRAVLDASSASNAGTGSDGEPGPHLHPPEAALASAPRIGEVIAGAARRSSPRVPGISVFMQKLPTIRIGGQLTKSQYQFTLQSPNTEELYRAAPDARGAAARSCPSCRT